MRFKLLSSLIFNKFKTFPTSTENKPAAIIFFIFLETLSLLSIRFRIMNKFILCCFLISNTVLCFSQRAVVSLPAMNVIYIGLDNPIEVAVEGYNNSQLTITTSGCEIIGNPTEQMFLRATATGKCEVTVKYEKDGLAQKQVFEYRTKHIPKPEVGFGALSEGNYPAAALLGQNSINAFIPGFVFMSVKYNVISYKWKYVSSTRLYSCMQTEFSSKIPVKLKTLIINGRIGDEIILDSIKCVFVGGVQKWLNPVTFQIESKPHNSYKIDFITYQMDSNSRKLYLPSDLIFDCDWKPSKASGIFKFYSILKNDTQLRLEIGLASSKVLYEKHFFSSGSLSQEYNFHFNDTVGDAAIYYENGQLKSKGKVIQNQFNVDFYRLPYFLKEDADLIYNLVHPKYPPIGFWQGYYKSGDVALSCEIELFHSHNYRDLITRASVLETFKLKERYFGTQVVKFKIYDHLNRVIQFKD